MTEAVLARRARRVMLVVAGLLFAAIAATALVYVWRTSLVMEGQRVFTLWDDAMISMRYARNLASGHGLVWNAGGEAVQGYSNFGLTLVMAALQMLPISAVKAPLLFQLFSLATAAVTVVYTGKLTRVLTGSQSAGIAAALVIAAFAPLIIWAAQGADSAPVALCIMLTVYYLTRAQQESGTVDRRAFIAAAVGIVIRLDFVLLYGLVMAFAVWSGRNRREILIWGGGLLVGTVGALLLFSQLYYGDPLPNTFYLKATGMNRGQMLASGWLQLKDHASGRFLVALLVAVLYLPLLIRAGRPFVLLYGLIVAFAIYFLRVGGDWVTMHTSRFLVPAIPLLVVVLLAGCWRAVNRITLAGPATRHLLLLAQVPLLVWLINRPVSLREWLSPRAPTMYRSDNRASLDYARYLAKYTRPDTSIGVYWAGVMPYHMDRVALDLLGRTDRHIAKGPPVPAATYWPGHAKRDWSYVIQVRKPDIMMSDMPELRSRPDYREGYCRALGGSLGFIVRKDSADKVVQPGIRTCHVAEFGYSCPPCGKAGEPRAGRSLFDFENGALTGWERSGAAFGPVGVHDAREPRPGQQALEGVNGRYLLNSYFFGDSPTGTLTSPEFLLEDRGLSLLVGGGNRGVDVSLWVEGVKVISATGRNSEQLERRYWALACHRGKRARLVVTDTATAGWGHLLVDDVRFEELGPPCAHPPSENVPLRRASRTATTR